MASVFRSIVTTTISCSALYGAGRYGRSEYRRHQQMKKCEALGEEYAKLIQQFSTSPSQSRTIALKEVDIKRATKLARKLADCKAAGLLDVH